MMQVLEMIVKHMKMLLPLGVLSRGDSVTRLESTGQLVTDVRSLAGGELLNTRLGNGIVTSRVEGTEEKKDNR